MGRPRDALVTAFEDVAFGEKIAVRAIGERKRGTRVPGPPVAVGGVSTLILTIIIRE